MDIRAGIESYGSFLSSLLSAFPPSSNSSTQIIILDNPSPSLMTLPLLPMHLNSQIRRKVAAQQRPPDDSSTGRVIKSPYGPGGGRRGERGQDSTGSMTTTTTIEPRRLSLMSVCEYFCDTVARVVSESQGGGVNPDGEDSNSVQFYNLHLYRFPRCRRWMMSESPAGSRRPKESQEEDVDIQVRYAVHKGMDESGYSGRERYTVVFD